LKESKLTYCAYDVGSNEQPVALLRRSAAHQEKQEWLAGRLTMPTAKEKNALDYALDDIREGKVISYNSLDELINDI
jgi:hypothetical protein